MPLRRRHALALGCLLAAIGVIHAASREENDMYRLEQHREELEHVWKAAGEAHVGDELAKTHFRLGVLNMNGKRSQEAREHFLAAVRLRPDMKQVASQSWSNLATMEEESGDLNLAEQYYRRALDVHADFVVGNFNLASLYLQRGKPALALPYARIAAQHRQTFARAQLVYASALEGVGDLNAAEDVLQSLLHKDASVVLAYPQLASVLQRQRRDMDAMQTMRKAVERHEKVPELWMGLGDHVSRHWHHTQDLDVRRHALGAYRLAIQHGGDAATAHTKIAYLLMPTATHTPTEEEKEQAARHLLQAIQHGEETPPVLFALLWSLRSTTMRSKKRNQVLPELLRLQPTRSRSILPLTLLSDAEVREVTSRYSSILSDQFGGSSDDGGGGGGAGGGSDGAVLSHGAHGDMYFGAAPRARIGYLSGNLRATHPTSDLFADAVRGHDAERVDVFVYSLGTAGSTPPRIAEAAAVFREVATLSLEETELLIRNDRLDVLVHLDGFTAGGNMHVAAAQPAPLQVSFLGYPGTCGAPFMPYLVADRMSVPPELSVHYTEKLLVLPDTYQVNSYATLHADVPRAVPPSRESLGLPEGAVVLGAFNQLHKVDVHTWLAWLRLLRKLPHAVLWLLDMPRAREVVLAVAEAKRADVSRIHFAPRVDKAAHLARLRVVDVMLDTMFENGHTTTSDALWAGVPVVTVPSRHRMTARVASSLLHAAGLPQLIARSKKAYENLVLRLVDDGDFREGVDRALARREKSALFDTARTMRHVERALLLARELRANDVAPAHVLIAADE